MRQNIIDHFGRMRNIERAVILQCAYNQNYRTVHLKMVKMAISAVQQGDPGLHMYAFFF